MSTTLNRSTWTNPDGLVIGYGPNKAVKEGSVVKSFGGLKTAEVTFNYDDMTGVNIPVPAGARIHDVILAVHTAFAGGTKLEVGDGSDADGFISATQGATANLTAGSVVSGTGAYVVDDPAAASSDRKVYAAADTIDLTVTGTFTAGKATLTVVYSGA